MSVGGITLAEFKAQLALDYNSAFLLCQMFKSHILMGYQILFWPTVRTRLNIKHACVHTCQGCGQCALEPLGSLLCSSALSTSRNLSVPVTVVFICKYTGRQIAPRVPMAFCLKSPWMSISWQASCSGGTPAEHPAGGLSALAHHRGDQRETPKSLSFS